MCCVFVCRQCGAAAASHLPAELGLPLTASYPHPSFSYRELLAWSRGTRALRPSWAAQAPRSPPPPLASRLAPLPRCPARLPPSRVTPRMPLLCLQPRSPLQTGPLGAAASSRAPMRRARDEAVGRSGGRWSHPHGMRAWVFQSPFHTHCGCYAVLIALTSPSHLLRAPSTQAFPFGQTSSRSRGLLVSGQSSMSATATGARASCFCFRCVRVCVRRDGVTGGGVAARGLR